MFLYRVENLEFGFGKNIYQFIYRFIYQSFEFSDPVVRDGNLNRGIGDFKGLSAKP